MCGGEGVNLFSSFPISEIPEFLPPTFCSPRPSSGAHYPDYVRIPVVNLAGATTPTVSHNSVVVAVVVVVIAVAAAAATVAVAVV